MDKFKTILNIASKQTNLSLGLIALLTAGGEQIFSNVVFKCPCDQLNFLYGLVFLLVPALALVTLGFILSKKTWKLVTGLCHQNDKVCGSCGKIKSLGNVLFQICAFALLAPSTWIAVALLNGVFIECAMTGTNMTLLNNRLCKGRKMEERCFEELPKFPCGKSGDVPQDVQDEVLLTLRAESQIVGWLLTAAIFLSLLCVTCLARCWSPVGYLQLRFWRLYAREEGAALGSYSAGRARELAERNVKTFFVGAAPEDVCTPSSQDWQRVSSLHMHRSETGGQYYSPLHCFVEHLTRNTSVRSSGSVLTTPAALGLVEDGRISLGMENVI